MSDLHVRRRGRSLWSAIRRALEHTPADLIILTGDYMTRPGDEPAAAAVMRDLLHGLRPRWGAFGVFGNHDLDTLRDACVDLPVTWLGQRCHRIPELGLELLGLDAGHRHFTDAVALVAASSNGSATTPSSATRPVRLLLTHLPETLPIAADLGVDVMFAGHTHGGQCRTPWGWAPVNSCDLPSRLTSGIMRHKDTLGLVTRGLGASGFFPMRVFCPPHLPLYTLRRGPMIGRYAPETVNLRPW